jgi:hypothetical protein
LPILLLGVLWLVPRILDLVPPISPDLLLLLQQELVVLYNQKTTLTFFDIVLL